ncbi:ATP synthase F1 subunit epsilon [Pelagibacterales bacterium SAG-MED16]|nr:ATP synthase F1 subunit epsilon [Pelagibacterales bacterium SAG-MED16]
MSEEYSVEIVNPEKSFLSKDDVTEVVVPAFEGEIGILRDHISIISFLKPGIIKIFSKSGEESFYVNDGIIEFKNNNLSILTSLILNLKDIDKEKISEIQKSAEEELNKSEINDQEKYLLNQKLEVLKSIN